MVSLHLLLILKLVTSLPEPCNEKTCLLDSCLGKTQTQPVQPQRMAYVVKKALSYVFVFAHKLKQFSHDAAHFIYQLGIDKDW